jgi:hypothetical protein
MIDPTKGGPRSSRIPADPRAVVRRPDVTRLSFAISMQLGPEGLVLSGPHMKYGYPEGRAGRDCGPQQRADST